MSSRKPLCGRAFAPAYQLALPNGGVQNGFTTKADYKPKIVAYHGFFPYRQPYTSTLPLKIDQNYGKIATLPTFYHAVVVVVVAAAPRGWTTTRLAGGAADGAFREAEAGWRRLELRGPTAGRVGWTSDGRARAEDAQGRRGGIAGPAQDEGAPATAQGRRGAGMRRGEKMNG